MEHLDEGFVGSHWVETAATHATASTASDIARQQQAAIDASQGGATNGWSRFATRANVWDATIPAPAAAARNTRAAACDPAVSDFDHPAPRRRSGQPHRMNDLRFLFDGLYLLAILLTSPWWVWQSFRYGKYRRGWKSKWLGIVPRRDDVACRPSGCTPSASAKSRSPRRWCRPEARWPATTRSWSPSTTDTGLALAQRRFPDDVVSYAPLDFSWAVRPGLANVAAHDDSAGRTGVVAQSADDRTATTTSRSCLVNGRLSERSFRGYRRIRWLVRRWLAKLAVIAVQDDTLRVPFPGLGCDHRPSDRHWLR